MSATFFTRTPAPFSARPIFVQAAAIMPVRPASGPTEPPNTSGNKNATTLAAGFSKLYSPVSFTWPITLSNGSGEAPVNFVKRPMNSPPAVQNRMGSHQNCNPAPANAASSATLASTHKRLVRNEEAQKTAQTTSPTTKPTASAKSTMLKVTPATAPGPLIGFPMSPIYLDMCVIFQS